MTVLDWLLDSDPAIRWQVLRDLVNAPGGGAGSRPLPLGADPGPNPRTGSTPLAGLLTFNA
jgi:hypothetical protein